MINNKKQMLMIIGIFALILLLTAGTYAFFNYTRNGLANNFRVGRIYFNSTQNDGIDLTNVFPITSEDLATDTDNHDSVTISIMADTEYTKGIV